jgi:hypothetical protein
MTATEKSDSRGLLERIAAFRQRLEAVQALDPDAAPQEARSGPALVSEAGAFRQQLQKFAGVSTAPEGPTPPTLTDRARRLLAKAKETLDRQRAIANAPFCGPDPLSDYHRETVALADSTIRLAQTLPESPLSQLKQCEGLESLLGLVRERIQVQERTLLRRRTEAERIDRLAAVYWEMSSGKDVSLTPVAALAEQLLEDARNSRPLRFVHTPLESVSSHPGGPRFAAPIRHLASHAIGVAQVVARLVPHNPEWSGRPLLAVVGALLIDCGMTIVPANTLSRSGNLPREERRLVDTHAQVGAEMILRCFPEIAPLAEAVGAHHERCDGTGYPLGLREEAITSLAKLFGVADVYAALNERRPFRGARDGRTALTEVLLLAEHGTLDRESAAALVRLSFYPTGSVVELTDGRVGVVVANHTNPFDPRTPGRPVIAVLADADETMLPHPEHVDLSTAERGGILRSLSTEERRRLLGGRYPNLV